MSDENYDHMNSGNEFMPSSYGFNHNPTLSLIQTFGENKFASYNSNNGSDFNVSNVPSFTPSSSRCNHDQFAQSSCPSCGGGSGKGNITTPPKKVEFELGSCHYMNQPHLCRNPRCRFHGGHQHHLNHQYHHLISPPPPLPGLLHPFAMVDPMVDTLLYPSSLLPPPVASTTLIPLSEFHERVHHNPHHKKHHSSSSPSPRHHHHHHHPHQTKLLNKCKSMQWLIIFNFYTTDQVKLMIETQSDNVPSSKMLRLPCKPVPTIGGETIQFRFQDTPQLKDCLTTFYHQYPWFSCTVRSNSTPRIQLVAAKFKTETFLNQLVNDIKHKNVIDIVFDEISEEKKRLFETQPILVTKENVKMQASVGPSNVGKEYFDIHTVLFEVPLELLNKGLGGGGGETITPTASNTQVSSSEQQQQIQPEESAIVDILKQIPSDMSAEEKQEIINIVTKEMMKKN